MGADRRAPILVAVVVMLVGLLPGSALASGKSGRLDPRFGAHGSATAPMTGVDVQNWEVADIYAARGPDGHLFVGAGSSNHPSVVAFDSKGKVDRGFGDGGRLSILAPDGTPLVIGGIAVDPGGRLVIAGESEAFAGPEPLVVRRYLPDGSPDPSFGGLGYAQLTPRLEPSPGVVEPGEPFLSGVEVDPAGRIIVAASVAGAPTCPSSYGYLARFASDGSVDTGFGTGGEVVFPRTILYAAENLTSTPDGLPVFSGAGARGVACPVEEPQSEGSTVDRLTASGTPDTGFDGDGRAALRKHAYALASGSGGTVLVLEDFGRVTELNADGTRNAKFDHDALADLAVHSELNAIIATPDGGALVTGAERVGNGAAGKPILKHVVLARLDRRGKLVRGFGDGGVVDTLPAGGKTQTVGEQVFLDGKGHAIVAGKLTGPKNPTAMLFLQYDLKP